MRYLGFAKFTLLLLAVAGPLGFYQAWRTHRSLLMADQGLRNQFAAEREALLKQLAQSFFAQKITEA